MESPCIGLERVQMTTNHLRNLNDNKAHAKSQEVIARLNDEL